MLLKSLLPVMACCLFVGQGLSARGVEALQAGASQAEITPAAGLLMWGYSDRTTPAQGALDPLRAKVLVLAQGDQRIAVIALDLGRTPEEAQLDELAALTRQACQIDKLFVTASHTHQAPNIESYDEPNPYVTQLLPKLAQAVAEAAGNLEPVTIAIARGQVDLAHNRRRVLPDGRVAMQWRNAQRDPTSPLDREFALVRFNRADGSCKAALWHYACHPVVLGSDHLQYSADYVGAARDEIEQQLRTTCLFLQGACGDINPYVDKTPVAQGGIEAMRSMGHTLARAVVAAAGRAVAYDNSTPSLQLVEQELPVRVRWDISQPEVHQVLAQVYGRRFTGFLAPRLRSGTIPLRLPILVVNNQLALVGVPGEVFVDFQLKLKRQSPVPNTFLVGYTSGYHAYFPTLRDAALGGYGGKTATYVEVGTAERVTDQALITLYRLLGALPPAPLPADFQLLEWDELRKPRTRP